MVIQAEIKTLDDLKRQREQSAAAMAGMVLPGFAIGGPVPGGGILALVHPGEFVMQKSAVDALGGNFLASLNRAPRFAEGGMVDSRRGSPAASHTTNFCGHMYVYFEKGMSRLAAKNMVIQAVRDAAMDGAL
jgi:hypothetical protein